VDFADRARNKGLVKWCVLSARSHNDNDVYFTLATIAIVEIESVNRTVIE